jgi:hypothetical protein
VKVIFEGGEGEENVGGAENEDNEGNDATGRVRRSKGVEGGTWSPGIPSIGVEVVYCISK